MKAKAYESALGDFVERELLDAAAAVGFFCCPCEAAAAAAAAPGTSPAAAAAAAAKRQDGVIRANCLDCLDRTNVLLLVLANAAVAGDPLRYFPAARQTTHRSEDSSSREVYRHRSSAADPSQDQSSVLRDIIKKMWADQGDSVSQHYTGTGSVFSSQIKQGGRSSFSSNIDHALKSIGRFYHNTFEDSFRQEIVNLIVGQHRLSGLHAQREGLLQQQQQQQLLQLQQLQLQQQQLHRQHHRHRHHRPQHQQHQHQQHQQQQHQQQQQQQQQQQHAAFLGSSGPLPTGPSSPQQQQQRHQQQVQQQQQQQQQQQVGVCLF
ncbi:hypothetical protein EBH_0058270 [Eimeria brunetti]|uniref:SAC domain-containing protein n=1 Tax=Eimeria brunetti TaxID=51314 RepID=U6M0N1_9EIME|nr:hypothetical protein EBH_0058270 [Eimeria brunetti]